MGNNLKSFKNILSLIDISSLVFMLVLVGFLATIHDLNPYTDKLIGFYAIVTIFVAAIAYYRYTHPNPKHNLIYLLGSIVIFLGLYESISGLLPIYVGGLTYDAWIDNLDKNIFGVSPTVWLQKITFPLLTEILYVFYFVYFLMPVLLVAILFRNKKYYETVVSMLTLFINYYGAYVLYFFVPVQGPRIYLAQEHTVPLEGYFFAGPIRDIINFFEPSTLDCFPSLHTSIVIIVTLLAARFYRRFYKLYFFLSIVIIFSLIYLRYHYILDVLAGALWAFVSFYLAIELHKRYHHKFQNLLVHQSSNNAE